MNNSVQQVTDAVAQERDAFVERLLQSTAGVFEIFTIYIGDRLGFYETLAGNGPLTAGELAARTGTQERYVREWLEQQAVAGVLGVDNEADGPSVRRFRMPPGHVEVLAERESLDYLAPLAQLVVGAVHPLALVVDAFRKGGGVPFSAYGADLREGQGRMNRAMFLRQLGSEWFPAIPDVHARLQADPPARVADIGCGAGWSSIGMALSYPKVRVDGFDLDDPSIVLARNNAAQADLDDRVRFHLRDAGDAELSGGYDLVAAFECIHDLSQPVSVLGAMRRLAAENGTVLVVDERVGDRFTAQGSGVECG
ncbi:MAG: class I SAM-dependent methyltransferase [Planctomycetota bacterium]|jgi:hypothetical protein